jgi:arylsulfatase A-like enzyme
MNNQPNIILIMTDDQGYGDLSCMGATDFRTPNLDRLATSGVRFTDWYANGPVCSPSRASLLTGNYPAHAGVRSILAGHRKATGIPADMPTLATILKDVGYHTALLGKWHLGTLPESRPEAKGFDHWFGFLAGCIDYYSHILYWGSNHDPVHDLWEDGKECYDNGRYFTEMISERAVEYVREQSRAKQPFFLYLAYNAPHYPMHAPQKYVDRFAHLPWDRRIMAAMLSAVDDGVGDVLDELERQGQLDNTFIFFQSDNGPSRETRNWLDGTTDPYYGGTTGKLKGHKFSLYDGGIRVPALMAYPDHIPGKQVVSEMGAAMDIVPTVMDLLGLNTASYVFDGKSVVSMVCDQAPTPHESIFFEMMDQTAVRYGDWKLVLNGQLVEGAPPQDDIHLSDLSNDMAEQYNLKDTYPDIAAELKYYAESWRAQLERDWETQHRHRYTGTT